jgi:RecA-family ATPase
LRSIAETTAKAAALAADPAADPEAVLAFTAGQLKASTERAKKSDAGVVAMDFDALETFDRKSDPNCVIGSRWMCRGYSCLLVSQSGVGKSSFSLQFMICLALRKSFFGIEAKRPLKVLFLQNENDEGDVSEALQDITGGMNLHIPERQQLKQNLIIYRLKRFTGQDFLDKMRDLIRLHAADVVVIDPLMAFIGIPAADQEAMTDWCRRGLDAVLTETGAVLFAVHHTTKPRSAKDKEGQTAADLAYSGAGASELVNYMREVAVLERCAGEEPVFKFSLTKRRGRSDLRDNNGDFAPSIYVRHSPTRGVIRWERSTPPSQDSDSSPSKGSRRRFDKE